jgi:hypothetical protein
MSDQPQRTDKSRQPDCMAPRSPAPNQYYCSLPKGHEGSHYDEWGQEVWP